MCFTDATNLICFDPKKEEDRKALEELQKKMELRKKYLKERIEDIDRGLKKIGSLRKRGRP